MKAMTARKLATAMLLLVFLFSACAAPGASSALSSSVVAPRPAPSGTSSFAPEYQPFVAEPESIPQPPADAAPWLTLAYTTAIENLNFGGKRLASLRLVAPAEADPYLVATYYAEGQTPTRNAWQLTDDGAVLQYSGYREHSYLYILESGLPATLDGYGYSSITEGYVYENNQASLLYTIDENDDILLPGGKKMQYMDYMGKRKELGHVYAARAHSTYFLANGGKDVLSDLMLCQKIYDFIFLPLPTGYPANAPTWILQYIAAIRSSSLYPYYGGTRLSNYLLVNETTQKNPVPLLELSIDDADGIGTTLFIDNDGTWFLDNEGTSGWGFSQDDDGNLVATQGVELYCEDYALSALGLTLLFESGTGATIFENQAYCDGEFVDYTGPDAMDQASEWVAAHRKAAFAKYGYKG